MPVLAVAVLATVTATAMVGTGKVPVPVLSGAAGSFALPAALLLPLVVSTAVVSALLGDARAVERVACRAMALFDAALVVAVAGLASVGVVLAGMAGAQPLAAGAARNVVGFVGVAVAARWVFAGAGAAMVPAVLALASATFGLGMDQDPRWWAWPVAAGTSGVAALTAAGWFAAGLAALVMESRPSRRMPASP